MAVVLPGRPHSTRESSVLSAQGSSCVVTARYLICLPSIDIFLTRACLRHICDKPNVLVVNNSCDDNFAKELEDQGCIVHSPSYNIGVAASWNIGCRKVLDEEIDYIFLMSCAIIFLQGGRELSQLPCPIPKHEYSTPFGYHLKPISRFQLEEVGLFDEGFFPGYLEDTDYERRTGLLGYKPNFIPVSAIDLGPAHAYTKDRFDFAAQQDHYYSKWGGRPGEETFTVPYGS